MKPPLSSACPWADPVDDPVSVTYGEIYHIRGSRSRLGGRCRGGRGEGSTVATELHRW
jgi:hypothetical protein